MAEAREHLVREQRRSQRFDLSLPLTLIRDSRGELHKVGETRNLSSTGVYFVVNEPIELGSILEFVVNMPEDVSLVGPVRSEERRVGKECRL